MSHTSETGAGLRRAIRLPHATALVVGTIVGASIFVQPSEITSQVNSIGGVLLVWSICGVLTLLGALVCAELASTFTRSGGVYVFLSEAYSPAMGFLWGWAMFWVVHSGIIAAVAVVFARYAAYFLPLGDAGTKATAVLVILLLSAVNYFGVQYGVRLQALFTLGKMVAIALIIAFGFALGAQLPEHFVVASSVSSSVESPSGVPTGVSLASFVAAIVAGLFAFGGWHMVTYSAGETVEPAKTIPRAMVLGTLIVTVVYVAMNAVYLYVLPLDVVAASTRVAADFADALVGSGGGAIMSGLVIFSTFGALSGIILAGPRVYYAMAQDGLVFSWLGEVHPRFHTPARALGLQAAWASVLAISGTYHDLFSRVIYTAWLFFGLLAVGLILLRRRPHLQRGYGMWGYPLTPLIFSAAAFFVVAVRVASDPGDSALGLLLVLSGLPVYAFWVSKRAPREG